MEELLKHLTEVSIRQQQIMEHMASRQGETERELAAIRMAAAPRTLLPDPRVQATQLLPRMTGHDDVTMYLQMFETVAVREAWPKEDWARIIAPLLTGEAQRAYFALPPELSTSYEDLRKEILGRMGLSPGGPSTRGSQPGPKPLASPVWLNTGCWPGVSPHTR